MSILATYSAPWKGMNTSVPDNHIDRSEAVLAQNITFYEGYMQQPSYSFPFPSGGTPDNQEILAVYSFTDANNNLHQGVITVATLYDGVSTSSWGTGYSLPASGTFITTQVFTNALFFVNGSTYVMYFDGITLAIQVATNQFGGKYIFELASSLCLAYTTEAVGGTFPQRVRWAVAGTINQWDPNTYIGAGFEDLRECPDGITGVMNTSPVAYIVRSNGITQMIPTGIGTSAFDFNHLWASQRGIGDVIGTTVTNYGPVGFVVAADDIYIITASSYERIGGKVKNTIYGQILRAIYGSFGWVESLISAGQPYLRYRIAINLANPDRTHEALVIWSFSTEDYKWEYETIDYNTYQLVCSGIPGNIGLVQTSGVVFNYPAIPVLKGTTVPTLLIEGIPAVGAILYPATYTFKREFDPEFKSTTVRQVVIRYQYLGNTAGDGVPVTVTALGMYGNSKSVTLNLADPSQTKQYYGGFPPPSVSGNSYLAQFSVPMTDYEYQIIINIGSPLNEATTSIRITDVSVFGSVGQEVVR